MEGSRGSSKLQDVFPAGCHVQLSDGLGSPAINKVVASEEAGSDVGVIYSY